MGQVSITLTAPAKIGGKIRKVGETVTVDDAIAAHLPGTVSDASAGDALTAIDDATAAIDAANATISDLQAQLTDLTGQNVALAQSNADLQAQVEDLQGQIAATPAAAADEGGTSEQSEATETAQTTSEKTGSGISKKG